jgi:hypothetical protein
VVGDEVDCSFIVTFMVEMDKELVQRYFFISSSPSPFLFLHSRILTAVFSHDIVLREEPRTPTIPLIHTNRLRARNYWGRAMTKDLLESQTHTVEV